MEQRINQGYEIIDSLKVNNTEFVIGEHPTAPDRYVTWECKDGNDYNHGHYMNDYDNVRHDFYKRIENEIVNSRNDTAIFKTFKDIRKDKELADIIENFSDENISSLPLSTQEYIIRRLDTERLNLESLIDEYCDDARKLNELQNSTEGDTRLKHINELVDVNEKITEYENEMHRCKNLSARVERIAVTPIENDNFIEP